MSTSIKKRVLALITTLALVVCMMVPAFAADVTEDDVIPVVAASYQDGGTHVYSNAAYGLGYLNAFTVAQVSDGVNVTTWPYRTKGNDQNWQLQIYDGITCRLATALNPNYVLDYYWGQSNPGNADLYHYSTSSNDISVAKDCALRVSGNMFYLHYYSDKYLAVAPGTLNYNGTLYHNVIWASAASSGSARIWSIA